MKARRLSSATTPLQRLVARREEINPALHLAWRLQQRSLTEPPSLAELMEIAPEIDKAMERGQKLQTETMQVLGRLRGIEGVPALLVPEGF